ncbi:MarR family transcriptional regulator [Staphylococcus aureus]|uniref:MarR family transcriptional regulator n=1 Tax=Staphylococcus aureus TaxID=1280 RepID=UPI000E3D8F40|nr:MarR family transcriptional regulator [Staphylococcus aureus]
MNTEKLETLLGFYKQYKALSEYIDKKYKLSLNDLAVLDLTMKHCKDEKVLMQSFLKIFQNLLTHCNLNNDDISKFNALFEDVEQFLNI